MFKRTIVIVLVLLFAFSVSAQAGYNTDLAENVAVEDVFNIVYSVGDGIGIKQAEVSLLTNGDAIVSDSSLHPFNELVGRENLTISEDGQYAAYTTGTGVHLVHVDSVLNTVWHQYTADAEAADAVIMSGLQFNEVNQLVARINIFDASVNDQLVWFDTVDMTVLNQVELPEFVCSNFDVTYDNALAVCGGRVYLYNAQADEWLTVTDASYSASFCSENTICYTNTSNIFISWNYVSEQILIAGPVPNAVTPIGDLFGYDGLQGLHLINALGQPRMIIEDVLMYRQAYGYMFRTFPDGSLKQSHIEIRPLDNLAERVAFVVDSLPVHVIYAIEHVS